MIKLIMTFLIVAGIVFGLIELITRMPKREKIATAKSVGYAVAVAAITTVIIATIVAIF